MPNSPRKTTPWNGFVRLPKQPYCPVCRRPLHVDAWALVNRMATCNRVECFSHPDAQIALTLIRKVPCRYAVINHVTGFFWTPNNADTDLLQFDLAAQHTIIG